ncbi:MAG TPA: YIP1 family protein [Thermoanaerobaculia bacterium]|nr:YIP1 family protein [Thermoanaerobaculia bacterium]
MTNPESSPGGPDARQPAAGGPGFSPAGRASLGPGGGSSALTDSSLGRLAGALFAPGKTFASIARRPTWAVAMLVLVVLASVVGFMAAQRMDFADLIHHRLAESGQQVPDNIVERQIEMAQKFGRVFAAGGGVFYAVILLLIALVFWVAFKLLGSDMDFRASLSTTLHACMPGAVAQLLSIPVILSRASFGYQDLRTGSFLTSNLAAFAGPDAKPWLLALLSSFDVFTLWVVALLAIGYRLVARVSATAATVTVVVLWLAWVAIRVGWSAIFG